MTANQIAAEANAIEREKLAEMARHNQESEFLEGEKNRINEAYNVQYMDIEQRKVKLNERLKTVELEITRSQGDKKLTLEEEANGIKQQLANLEQYKADIDAQYKTGMLGYEGMKTGELERSNKAREAIQDKANTIRKHEVDIQEREQMGATPLSRSRIIQAAGSVKGPVGLASLGIFEAGELGHKLGEAIDHIATKINTTDDSGTQASKTKSASTITINNKRIFSDPNLSGDNVRYYKNH